MITTNWLFFVMRLPKQTAFAFRKNGLWIPQGGTAFIRFLSIVGIVLINIKPILNRKSKNPYIRCCPILKNVYMINLVFWTFDTYNKSIKCIGWWNYVYKKRTAGSADFCLWTSKNDFRRKALRRVPVRVLCTWRLWHGIRCGYPDSCRCAEPYA